MTRTIITAAILLATVGLAVPAHAQTRDDIIENVIARCFTDAVEYFKIAQHDERPFATIVVTLDREYHKELIDSVSTVARPHTKHAVALWTELGQAVCVRHNAAAITCKDGETTYSVGDELNGKHCYCGEIGCYWQEPD